MTPERDIPLTKCPACGKVQHGLLQVCPACGHLFSDPQATLPIARPASRRVDLSRVRTRLASNRLPPHVTIPFVAGLLVALAVILFVQFAGMDPGSGKAVPGRPRSQPAATAASAPPPALAPGVVRTVPSGVEFPEQQAARPETRARWDATFRPLLLGTTHRGCVPLTPGADDPETLVFSFARPLRFSHVTLQIGCVATRNANQLVDARMLTEDGQQRRVRVPGVPGAISVDLAGAWSSTVRLELASNVPSATSVGLARIEFFTFEEEKKSP